MFMTIFSFYFRHQVVAHPCRGHPHQCRTRSTQSIRSWSFVFRSTTTRRLRTGNRCYDLLPSACLDVWRAFVSYRR